MKIAVISDLHIGLGDRTDQFGHDDYEFTKFLNHLESNFERIILLGDIYETLTTKLFGRSAEAFFQIYNKHREVVERLQRSKYTYIHGNHDLVAAKVLSAPEQITLGADEKHILFTHGHQFDFLTDSHPKVSEFAVWVGGWVQRMGADEFHDAIDALDQKVRKSSSDTFRKRALRYADNRAIDIIVTGHTHIGECVQKNKQLFLNSGSCSQGKISFVSIDTNTMKCAVNTNW